MIVLECFAFLAFIVISLIVIGAITLMVQWALECISIQLRDFRYTRQLKQWQCEYEERIANGYIPTGPPTRAQWAKAFAGCNY